MDSIFLIELLASVLFVIFFGFGNFLLFLLVSILVGCVLLGIFWRNALNFEFDLNLKNTLRQFGFVLAGFLFILPGVISTFLACGILCFCLVLEFLKPRKKNDEEIIDVEIIEDTK